jgi:hypothetical protein
MVKDSTQELERLRKAVVTSKPGARLVAIRQKLARSEGEPAATRLVTAVAAVEALARSLVVHGPHRPPATAHIRYQQMLFSGPLELVEESLRIHGAGAPVEFFGRETWSLFELAHQFRNLAVHECTSVEAATAAPLIRAAERVLEGLVETGGLLRVVS